MAWKCSGSKKISENSHFESKNGALEDDFLLQMGDF